MRYTVTRYSDALPVACHLVSYFDGFFLGCTVLATYVTAILTLFSFLFIAVLGVGTGEENNVI